MTPPHLGPYVTYSDCFATVILYLTEAVKDRIQTTMDHGTSLSYCFTSTYQICPLVICEVCWSDAMIAIVASLITLMENHAMVTVTNSANKSSQSVTENESADAYERH